MVQFLGRLTDKKELEVFEVKVKELKEIEVGFNISAIAQIRFKNAEALTVNLKAQLIEYYENYKIEYKH